jgi:hypothetical protein
MFRLISGALPPALCRCLRTFALPAGSRARSLGMCSQRNVKVPGKSHKRLRKLPARRYAATLKWHVMTAREELVQANAHFGAYPILVLHHNYSR